MRVITELVGDLADIYSPEKGQTGRLAARLLDAAGPGRRREVRTVTGGSGPVFRVPVDIARAAGFINEPANAGNSSGSEATTDDAAGAGAADAGHSRACAVAAHRGGRGGGEVPR
ncbi:hypothetical protein [Nocardia cyriacigeorgica]|uniref:hypothetical protein n=1 Tax=Nocardia cyriacigeorgica TaxID=135487 RepID=UPI002456C681|nr:hypothetical protein [Nocardia cyriacigeorgica]